MELITDVNIVVLIMKKLSLKEKLRCRLVCKLFAKAGALATIKRLAKRFAWKNSKQSSFSSFSQLFRFDSISIAVGESASLEKMKEDFIAATPNFKSFKKLTLVNEIIVQSPIHAAGGVKCRLRPFDEQEADFIVRNFSGITNLTFSKVWQYSTSSWIKKENLSCLRPLLQGLTRLDFGYDKCVIEEDVFELFREIPNLTYLVIPRETGGTSSGFSDNHLLKSLTGVCPNLTHLDYLLIDVSEKVFEAFLRTHGLLTRLILGTHAHEILSRHMTLLPKLKELGDDSKYVPQYNNLNKCVSLVQGGFRPLKFSLLGQALDPFYAPLFQTCNPSSLTFLTIDGEEPQYENGEYWKTLTSFFGETVTEVQFCFGRHYTTTIANKNLAPHMNYFTKWKKLRSLQIHTISFPKGPPLSLQSLRPFENIVKFQGDDLGLDFDPSVLPNLKFLFLRSSSEVDHVPSWCKALIRNKDCFPNLLMLRIAWPLRSRAGLKSQIEIYGKFEEKFNKLCEEYPQLTFSQKNELYNQIVLGMMREYVFQLANRLIKERNSLKEVLFSLSLRLDDRPKEVCFF